MKGTILKHPQVGELPARVAIPVPDDLAEELGQLNGVAVIDAIKQPNSKIEIKKEKIKEPNKAKIKE